MFKKNIEELKKKNKVLARRLQQMSLEEAAEHIEVYEAESKDYIISYDGLALDDIYDPIRVSKTNWNANAPKNMSKYDIVFIFGLGLGYLFKRAYISTDCRIILYEPKIDILRYILEYVDLSNEIADDRVFFTTDKKCALNFVTEKYLSEDKLVFLYPQAYAQLLTQELISLTDDIVQVCNMKKMDVNTITMLAKNWANHSMQNILNMKTTRPFSWLGNKYKDKTALIAAAGPSLKDNIETIKQNRDKFIIFCVNRSAKYLFDNDITPDFVLFADTLNIDHTINGIEDKLKTTNLIVDFRANNTIFEKFDNILTYFSKNDLVAQNINSKLKEPFVLSETAGTAVAQAYYCTKMLGINDIVFAGLDLAFKGDVLYAEGNKVIKESDNVMKIETSDRYKKNIVTVKDLNGNDIETRDDYALFIRQFADIFENDETSKLYNISSFGAYIKGMKYTTLEELLQTTTKTEVDISKDVKQLISDTKEKWDEIYAQLKKYLSDEKDTLKSIKVKAEELLSKETELLQKINNKHDANTQNELVTLTQEFSGFLSQILFDAFLSQYFQSEFLNFANLNNKNTNPGLEAFVELKNFEIKLLEDIVAITGEWVKFLEEQTV